MSLPNFKIYKYIMFVDASGDDGYKFKDTSNDGSSYSFVVSCFVTTPQELTHNNQVLLKMKHALSVKPEQELKSTALKRHRNAISAYKKMEQLHGFAYSFIADKRLLHSTPANSKNDLEDIYFLTKHELGGVTHIFPYVLLRDSELLNKNDKILIVIDNMKKHEMDIIKVILSEAPMEQYDLIFRDSKDKNFSLIQIADIFAGTIRTYYENCLPLSTHNQYCKGCGISILMNQRTSMLGKCMEAEPKQLFLPYVSDYKFNTVMSFHQNKTTTKGMADHLIILPFSQMMYFTYIDCHIFQTRPWK